MLLDALRCFKGERPGKSLSFVVETLISSLEYSMDLTTLTVIILPGSSVETRDKLA